jgi:hypothetical protein
MQSELPTSNGRPEISQPDTISIEAEPCFRSGYDIACTTAWARLKEEVPNGSVEKDNGYYELTAAGRQWVAVENDDDRSILTNQGMKIQTTFFG